MAASRPRRYTREEVLDLFSDIVDIDEDNLDLESEEEFSRSRSSSSEESDDNTDRDRSLSLIETTLHTKQKGTPSPILLSSITLRQNNVFDHGFKELQAWRPGLVADTWRSNCEVGVRVLLSAGRRLVPEQGCLHIFLRLTHALKECTTKGSERSCQNATVMHFTCCSSVSSEDTEENPSKA
ncbi:hypothetical protein ElyMa_006278500 [Elysia marginata]|uniref:Uncharacterized protein n=1 Tax=Elysia marginata TaxID=1093978 RepID=A0AAV4HCL2_9GAST|nr:hypothetical protein ElyMa_006278500 [Elysia marginata]